MKLNWRKNPKVNILGEPLVKLEFSRIVPELIRRAMKMEPSELVQGDTYLLNERTPISNQGQMGSCAANASVDSLEIVLGYERPDQEIIQLSRLGPYFDARLINGETQLDSGTFIHNVFQVFKETGVGTEADYPYSDGKDDNGIPWYMRRPPLRYYENADANRIKEFYAISSRGEARLDDIEAAIRSNHPVVFGTLVGSDLLKYETGSNLTLKPPTGVIEGGHAMVITGVQVLANDRRRFRIRNSWGSGWGEEGHVWFNQDYLTWDQTDDFTVPTMVPVTYVTG